MPTSRLEVICVCGTELARYVDALAHLRIAVFREYPYLYDGDIEYERKYLHAYAQAKTSVFALALQGSAVVGVSTAIALPEADDVFKSAWKSTGFEATDTFYFGESVLLRSYRGLGIGHRFFDERERHAASCGAKVTCFCSVLREPADARRPAGYRPLDDFWCRRGYTRHPDTVVPLSWKDVGDADESTKRLEFWSRQLG